MLNLTKKVSATLMAANLFATILVISTHYTSKGWMDVAAGYGWNRVIQEFVSNGMARVAVPFFAMLSGMFLCGKLHGPDGYVAVLKNKARTLLAPYILVSILVLAAVTLLHAVPDPRAHHMSGWQFWVYNAMVHPVAYQFWFLRDLIVLAIISPVILSKKPRFSSLLALALGGCWLLDLQLLPTVGGWYVVNIETLFFFCVGGLIARNTSLLAAVVDAPPWTKWVTLAIWLLLIGARISMDPHLSVWYVRNYTLGSLLIYKLSIGVGVVSLIQISVPCAKHETIIYLSGLTFFAYLFHLAPLSFFQKLTAGLASAPYRFYWDFPIAVMAVFVAAHLASKYLPTPYAWVTGGRNPAKALQRTRCA